MVDIITTTTTTDAFVLDFDGTITLADVGDELCDRFADPSWRDLDARWERGEICLADAQLDMWALVDAPRTELLAYARAVGRLRPGLDAFLEAAAARGAELVLASGGFDFYIEELLGPARLARFARRLHNVARVPPDGGGVQVSFPHREALGCPLCGVCKGRVVDELRAQGRRVTFIGDGTSDRCAIGRADGIYAVRAGKLAAQCRARGAAASEFESFDEIR